MSLIETYQSRKSLFAQKLITKGVQASADDGLTTLINKIDNIDDSFEEGVFLKGSASIAQTGDSINLTGMLIEDNHFVAGATIDFYEHNGVIFEDKGVTGSSYQSDYLGLDYLNVSVSGTGTFVENAQSSDQFLLVNKTGTSKSASTFDDYDDFMAGDAYSIEIVSVTGNVYLYVDNDFSLINSAGVLSGTVSVDDSYIGLKLEAGANVVFKDFVVTGEALVGSVATNQYGVASTSVSCRGSGLREFYAIYGIFLSETYEVSDCIFEDMNNSKQPNDYTKVNFNNCTLTTENDYKKFTMSSTQTVVRIVPCEVTGDFEVLFEVKTPYYLNVGVYCQDDSANKSSYTSLNDAILDDDSWYYIKVKRVNQQLTVQYSSDNNNWTNSSLVVNKATDETCKFNISSGYSISGKEKVVYFKNMRVYPI